jgi:hypothetical protein
MAFALGRETQLYNHEEQANKKSQAPQCFLVLYNIHIDSNLSRTDGSAVYPVLSFPEELQRRGRAVAPPCPLLAVRTALSVRNTVGVLVEIYFMPGWIARTLLHQEMTG